MLTFQPEITYAKVAIYYPRSSHKLPDIFYKKGVLKDIIKTYFYQRHTLFYTTLCVGYFIYFKFTPVSFKWMSNSIKAINRLRNEINRLLSKGMLNIKSYNWEKLTFPKLRFSNCIYCRHRWILKLLVAT